MAVRRIVPDVGTEVPARSVAFYVDVLGLEVAMDLGWVVTLRAPGSPTAQISVLRSDPTAPMPPDLSVEVDDVDAVHATAERLGYEIVHPLTNEAWGVRRFFVREPGGKVVNVLAHR